MEINPDKYGVIISVITKEYIENNDFQEIQNFYNQMLEAPLKYENKVAIIIQGYEEDSRELFEIQEIRDYFVTLDRLFPYWFYFLIRKSEMPYSPLVLVMTLLVPTVIVNHNSKRNTVEYDMPKFIEFMNMHFHYLNELTDKLGLSQQENKRISEEVKRCFQ